MNQSYRTSSLTRPEPAFRAPHKVHPIDLLFFTYCRRGRSVILPPFSRNHRVRLKRLKETGMPKSCFVLAPRLQG